MNKYKYQSILEVMDAFKKGELEGYILDVDWEWVSLRTKNAESDLEQGFLLWGGQQPDEVLLEIFRNIDIPMNEGILE